MLDMFKCFIWVSKVNSQKCTDIYLLFVNLLALAIIVLNKIKIIEYFSLLSEAIISNLYLQTLDNKLY
jgi:hypothetical protein